MANRVWIFDETEAWIPAPVVTTTPSSVTVRLDGKDVTKSGNLSKFDIITPGSLEEDCENLVDLENFNEGIILHHIRTRFNKQVIYTFVGSILIALNPYKKVDIYGVPIMDATMSKLKSGDVLPPHVYSIGATALYNLRTEGKDQAVLISGESGAGKTEATKKILQFLSTMAGSTQSRVGVSVENQILDSNPLLESFGNAKTLRNNNSSRFGKYMEVNFDKKNNIKGCNVVAYLLEKSRVVRQTPNERNYHAFYMLLEGATKEMKIEYNLKPADQFAYLSQSGCVSINNRSDKAEFEELLAAMDSLAIDPAVRLQIFQGLAGILHLGNLTFVPRSGSEVGSRVSNSADCRTVATLLGVNSDGLEMAMCFRETTIRGETTMTPLDAVKTIDQRDALAKYVYGKIFDTIVSRVNQSLYRGKPGNSIGVLDIFGFEVFKLNSFEQLCINYCNERLQTFFNEIIFEGEIKMYSAEGVPCDDITFQDNIDCVKLIEQRGASIFAFLDDEINVPQGSDDKFVAKLHQIFDESATSKSLYYGRNRKVPREFIIHHFAGPVAYNVTDFMEKNKDALSVKLLEQIQNSSLPILRDNEAIAAAAAVATGGASGKARGGKLTLSAKFKADLDNLMAAMRKTTPHFIRCVKPNDFQVPDVFNAPLALNQLKYSGLFEAIRIRKSGYSVRLTMDLFIKRYHICATHLPKEVRAKPVDHCNAMIKFLAAKLKHDNVAGAPRQWFVGNTRVFLRTQQFRVLLEALRDSHAAVLAVPIQKIARGFIARRRFLKLVAPQLANKAEEKKNEKRESDLMAAEDALAMSLEEIVRNDKDLQRMLAQARQERILAELEKQRARLHAAATVVQRIFRGKLTKHRGRVFMCEEMFRRSFSSRDEGLLKRALVLPHFLGVTSKIIKQFQHDAKELLLVLMNETHVKNELQLAIRSGAVELLEQAIELAEGNKLYFLPILGDARAALAELTRRRSVLHVLEGVLSRCVSIPTLVAHVDSLRSLVQQCTELNLGGEYMVTDATLRLKRVNNLIVVRDKIRFAVEICSASEINCAMREREKLLKIYGQDFLGEEALAVAGMQRMFAHEKQLTDDVVNNNGRRSSSSFDDNSSRLDLSLSDLSISVDPTSSTTASNLASGSNLAQEIRLPPWVLQQLEKMRHAESMRDLNRAVDEFAVLVPDEHKRREFVRMFKWVVAFATWRFEKTSEEKIAHEKHRKLLAAAASSADAKSRLLRELPDATNANSGGGDGEAVSTAANPGSSSSSIKSLKGQSKASSNSPAKGARGDSNTPFLSPATATAESGAQSPQQQQELKKSKKKPQLPIPTYAHAPSARSTADLPLPSKYARASGLAAMLSPGFSFGSASKDSSSPGSPHKRTAAAARAPPGQAPFSQRQSKADVAFYMAQKHAEMVNPALAAKNDKSYVAAMHEYDEYWHKTNRGLNKKF